MDPELKQYLDALAVGFNERINDVTEILRGETNLLLEIRAISTAVKARIGRLEGSETTLNARMAALEDRMDLLEQRQRQ